MAKASEKLVEIVAQAGDCVGVGFAPALGEAAGGRARFHRRVGVHDGVQIGFDRRLVDFLTLSMTLRILCVQQRWARILS